MTTDKVPHFSETGEPVPTEDAMEMLALFTKALLNRLTPFRRMVELPWEELEEAGELHVNVQPQDTHMLLSFVDGPPPAVPTFMEPKVADSKTGIAPGTKLKNGATVLLSAGPGAGDYCVVLAQVDHGEHHVQPGRTEYVTWRVAADTLDAFWGDYFSDDLPAACESFLARGFGYGTSRFNAA